MDNFSIKIDDESVIFDFGVSEYSLDSFVDMYMFDLISVVKDLKEGKRTYIQNLDDPGYVSFTPEENMVEVAWHKIDPDHPAGVTARVPTEDLMTMIENLLRKFNDQLANEEPSSPLLTEFQEKLAELNL